jgi:hypothetical protein
VADVSEADQPHTVTDMSMKALARSLGVHADQWTTGTILQLKPGLGYLVLRPSPYERVAPADLVVALDTTQPAEPKVIAHSDEFGRIGAVALTDCTLFLQLGSADEYMGSSGGDLVVTDVCGDTPLPREVGRLKQRSGRPGLHLVARERVYLADDASLAVIDVAVRSRPAVIARLDTPTRLFAAESDGQLLYLAAGPAGVFITDLR